MSSKYKIDHTIKVEIILEQQILLCDKNATSLCSKNIYTLPKELPQNYPQNCQTN
jgi:hypothetical protein